ncbi:hypothetical protein MMC31_002611 [Peltigera leucophlebia]|nr:hypothetical protein [Peltigera leucophlebia]
MFKKRIRTGDKTFGLLYGMAWERVLEYAENPSVLKVLTAHATAIANGPSPIGDNATSIKKQVQKTELRKLGASFVEFADALEEGGYQQDFLEDVHALETVKYWKFWKQHLIYQDFI